MRAGFICAIKLMRSRPDRSGELERIAGRRGKTAERPYGFAFSIY